MRRRRTFTGRSFCHARGSRLLHLLESLVSEVQRSGVLGDGADDRFVEAVGGPGRDLDGHLDRGRGVSEVLDDLLDDPTELQAEPL